MAKFKAAVIGGSGYGGGEIIRRLRLHPEVELLRVSSIDYVGEPLSAAHPNLEGAFPNLKFEKLTATETAAGADIVLLGLPHKVAAAQVKELSATNVKIVDLSGDFRLKDVKAYEKHYGTTHPCPELLSSFVYGLPELNREAIKKSKYVASPGCFATTIELGLLPLAKKGWLEGSIDTVGITGSSGSGVAASAGTHHPTRSVNLKTYKTLTHQHLPEISETLIAAGARQLAIQMVPVSAPLSRGLFVTTFVYLDAKIDPKAVEAAFSEYYEREPFVRVPKKRLPEVAAVAGSNYAEVGVVAGEIVGDKRVYSVISATDNLIKGGAGQGVQNMNLLLGLDERLSLEDPGSWP
jgi:LysW-gamma-L-alpha-aminoadipyl-6-phosphate/LysW-L-glutamyl-5-phosphate reductase